MHSRKLMSRALKAAEYGRTGCAISISGDQYCQMQTETNMARCAHSHTC